MFTVQWTLFLNKTKHFLKIFFGHAALLHIFCAKFFVFLPAELHFSSKKESEVGLVEQSTVLRILKQGSNKRFNRLEKILGASCQNALI